MGFGLKKVLRTCPPEDIGQAAAMHCGTDGSTAVESRPQSTKKDFSLDFPPGKVHTEAECVSVPKRWNKLKKIIEKKKTTKKRSGTKV